jgi:hypothetical protein
MLAQFRPGFDGGIDQQLVEHRTSGTVRLGDVAGWRWCSSEGERPKIHGDGGNWWAAGCGQSPA